MRIKLISLLLLGIIFSKLCFADESSSQIGRYLTLSNKPKFSQIELLSQIIQVRFPQNIQTINTAMNYILRFSGYELASQNNMGNEIKIMLNKPLPIVDRELGPMSIKDGLLVLAGPAFYLIEDPVNRLVIFRIKPNFQKLNSILKEKH
jgi:conjugative transfer region protein (TIGR03748 family)